MAEAVRLDKKALRAQYHVSERLAVRVGALLARDVGVTAAVLELAAPGSAGEALLLSPMLLDRAARLSRKDLAAAAGRGKDARSLPPLAIHVADGLRTICLDEEIEAEKGFSRPSRGELALPSSRSLLKPEEARTLFTPEEMARLKFVLLTSADPKAKIEAIRTVLVSPLSPEEKGVLCLLALADAHTDVRRETAAALKHLGLNPDLTDSIRNLTDPDPRMRKAALVALQKIGPKASAAERGVILRVLFGALETEKDPELAAAGVDVLAHMSEALGAAADSLPDLVRLVLSLLAANFDALSPATRRLCRELGRVARKPLAEVLWRHVEKTDERRHRAYLLLLLGDLSLAADARKRLATEVAGTLAAWSDSEPDCRRLAAALEGLGDPGIRALIDAFPSAREEQQPFLLHRVDALTAKGPLSRDIAARLSQFLLGLLPSARRSLRLALLETRLLYHESLPAETKRKLAEELLRSAHDYRLDRVYDLAETVLTRMGLLTAEPLMRTVDESPYEPVRILALRILARHVAHAHEADAKETVQGVCRWAERLLREFPAQGEAARAVGTLATGAHAPADFVERVAVELLARVRKGVNAIDDLQALASLSGSRAAPMKLRMELAMLFLELLETEIPEDLANETRTQEGTLLEVKRPAQLYTDFLPAVVDGLERVAVAAGTTEALRERVTQRLLAKWAEVSEYRVIWGPNAVARLAESLGAIGVAADTPLHLKLAVLNALRSRLSNVPIARVLGRILEAPEEADSFLQITEELASEMCAMAVHRDYREREDRQTLLDTLGRLAGRRKLATQTKRTEAIRGRILELLFEAVRDRISGAREALARLATADLLPKAQRTQIQQRLARL